MESWLSLTITTPGSPSSTTLPNKSEPKEVLVTEVDGVTSCADSHMGKSYDNNSGCNAYNLEFDVQPQTKGDDQIYFVLVGLLQYAE